MARPGERRGQVVGHRQVAGHRLLGRRLVGRRLVVLAGALLLVLLGLGVPGPSGGPAVASAAAAGPVTVRVEGNRLVDAAGAPLVLRGVNRSGPEYACVQGFGTADGPMTAESVAAMTAWAVTAVRVPLNQDCWLGTPGVDPALSGEAYRRAITDYVGLLHAAGMVAVLDLHWSAPGTQPATGQSPMADADSSPAFWTSVATRFRDDPGVLFDLFNEPRDISWRCWRDGCTEPGYATAGMQALVDAVRATGARQPVMVGPLGYAGAVGGPEQYGADPARGWLAWRPVDPLGALVLSWHVYDFSGCAATACWDSQVAPIAAQVPVVVGELGETDCGTDFTTRLLDWTRARGISTVAWSWNASSDACGGGGPNLVRDYAGTPTTWGAAVREHYRSTAASSTSPSSTSPATTSPATTTPATTTPVSPVSVAPASTAVGVATLLTATAPAGTVSFADGNTGLPGCQARPVRDGRATCVATFPAPGTRTVTATHAAGAGTAALEVAPRASLLQLLTGFLVGLAHALGLLG